MDTLKWLTSLFSNCLLCDGDDGCTRDRMLMFAYLYLIIVFIQSVKFAAPYGKFLQQSSNSIPDTFLSFRINSTYGWMLQEIPAFLVGFLGILQKISDKDLSAGLIFLPFTIHYFNRSLVFPFQLKSGKSVPFLTVVCAFQFCLCNGVLQYMFLNETKFFHSHLAGLVGMLMFVCGMMLNIHSDHILINLRKPGDTGYKIPNGGGFSLISAPNYFGEILEWWGWFLMNPNHGSFWFACFTSTFLGLRAVKTHQFYKTKFEDYPKARKAVLPYIC